MKRLPLITTTVSAMLALAAPGVASAHNRAERHHHHHARHANTHHRHAKRATVRTFGSPPGARPGATTTPPATPPSTSGGPAGTVASFTGGVLTITLTNGSTVSGQVTDQTEIRCLSSAPLAEDEAQGDDREGARGGDSGRGDDLSSGDGQRSGGGDPGDDDGPGGDHDPGDGQSCATTALVAGAVVREARLRLSSAGAVWDRVALIV